MGLCRCHWTNQIPKLLPDSTNTPGEDANSNRLPPKNTIRNFLSSWPCDLDLGTKIKNRALWGTCIAPQSSIFHFRPKVKVTNLENCKFWQSFLLVASHRHLHSFPPSFPTSGNPFHFIPPFDHFFFSFSSGMSIEGQLSHLITAFRFIGFREHNKAHPRTSTDTLNIYIYF